MKVCILWLPNHTRSRANRISSPAFLVSSCIQASLFETRRMRDYNFVASTDYTITVDWEFA